MFSFNKHDGSDSSWCVGFMFSFFFVILTFSRSTSISACFKACLFLFGEDGMRGLTTQFVGSVILKLAFLCTDSSRI